jgi:hypothetical protein
VKLPRHAEVWLAGYLSERFRRLGTALPADGQGRVWLTVADHYEPLWGGADEKLGLERVGLWRRKWPEIAARHPDSANRPARYTFFYPEDEYRPRLLDPLAELCARGVADVEVHIHHGGEGELRFVEKMGTYLATLSERHGLLRRRNDRPAFGFIHGNWALDNSRPDGECCGLNNEITLLRDLGCYADFTMPSGPSPTQARKVNSIYWAVDEPGKPKSYDTGAECVAGGPASGDLMMIPGPLGLRWKGRLIPRMDMGELAGYDLPTSERVDVWMRVAPRIGNDIFIKLFSHGTQERNSGPLLDGGLDHLYDCVAAECRRRGYQYYFASAWEMFQGVEQALGWRVEQPQELAR